MTVLFLLCAGLLAQTYAGYPLSLLLIRLILGDRSRHRTADAAPPVTLIISAYNEEAAIREKIENSLALDYPQDRLKIIVVSDGSTDRTEAIVRSYANRGVLLQAFPERSGKVACLNRTLPGVDTGIAVMSDANSMYAPGGLRKLVRHFADDRVGCVCGRLEYLNPRALAAGEGERVYWNYEGWIKRLESGLGTLLGANGAIYAFRACHFHPVDPLMFCDDVIPIRIGLEGLLTIYDPEAVCREESADERVEMRRRRRHASFGLRSMIAISREALARGRWLILYEAVCHRVLRWLGGPALAGLLLSSPFLPGGWARLAMLGQAIFYGAAGLGFLLSRNGHRVSILYLPYYYLMLSLAGVRGLWDFVRGTDRPDWEPRR